MIWVEACITDTAIRKDVTEEETIVTLFLTFKHLRDDYGKLSVYQTSITTKPQGRWKIEEIYQACGKEMPDYDPTPTEVASTVIGFNVSICLLPECTPGGDRLRVARFKQHEWYKKD